MKLKNKAGFTLIELLVVVLIIAVLTAVAVPQYQKSVKKAQYARMLNALQSAVKAQQVYFLTNGEYATNFDELDITFPPVPAQVSCVKWLSSDVGKPMGDFCMYLTNHPARSIRTQLVGGSAVNGYQYFFENVSYFDMGKLKAKNYYCVESRAQSSKDKHCSGTVLSSNAYGEYFPMN